MKPPIPVAHPLREDGSSPIPPREALQAIRAVWIDWAKHATDEDEAMALIAELLEQAGYPVISGE